MTETGYNYEHTAMTETSSNYEHTAMTETGSNYEHTAMTEISSNYEHCDDRKRFQIWTYSDDRLSITYLSKGQELSRQLQPKIITTFPGPSGLCTWQHWCTLWAPWGWSYRPKHVGAIIEIIYDICAFRWFHLASLVLSICQTVRYTKSLSTVLATNSVTRN
jgi:hypothetical protein